jgi:hypothetical protein
MQKNAISLGFNCSAAGIAVSRGLRGRKQDGYLTCPFDMMFTFDVCHILENDFADFCNPDYLELRDLDGDKRIVHTKYACVFNHESPDHFRILGHDEKWTGPQHFTENNYCRFIQRYQRRIANFREYVRRATETQTELNFVITRYNEIPTDVDELLTRKYPELKFKIHYNASAHEEIERYQLAFLGFLPDHPYCQRLQNFTEKSQVVGNCIPL